MPDRVSIASLAAALLVLASATPAAASDFSPMYYMLLGVYLAVSIPLCIVALWQAGQGRARWIASAVTGFVLAPIIYAPYPYVPVGLYAAFPGGEGWRYLGVNEILSVAGVGLLIWVATSLLHRRVAR